MFQILYRLFFRSASKSSMEHPSTPGAPLLSLTFSHACHTSAFEISNGLPDDFSSLTRLLPDLSPVDRTNMPRMTWPLRSTPTATAGTSPPVSYTHLTLPT